MPETKIRYLLGEARVANKPMQPYSDLVCDFLNDLSSELKLSKEAADYPDILTFAFWCRRANIQNYKKDFEDGKARLGLGQVFHIAPSNVPVNFAFSFVFGLLSGNANVVRVPSKNFPQIGIVCAALRQLFSQKKYSEIKSMTAFIQYEADDAITALLSAESAARVIWGGNETIRSIRKLPLPERGVDIAFSDRYSLALIHASNLLEAHEEKFSRVVEGFYNDTYLMDQNACSAPHLILWQGAQAGKAQERFWTALQSLVEKKYLLEPVQALDKYTQFCNDAVKFQSPEMIRHGNSIYRVNLLSLPQDLDSIRGQYGYFYEYKTEDFRDLAKVINSKYQTLSYFGFEKGELLDFVLNHRLTGIDRIVPIGMTLDMNVLWDGYDIVRTLSRVIDVK